MYYDYLKLPDSKRGLNIAMVSDYFYPSVGGVESHIYSLSQCLIRRGHRVIVITHCYGSNNERQGVRYMARGLKVYYLPLLTFYKQSIFVSVFGTLSIFREILYRENVDIVHGHSIFSVLACDGVCHAKSIGYSTVFTEHSLSGFSDLSSIIVNKVMQGVYTNVDVAICVSYTTKMNVLLRADFSSDRTYVIPNAVDSSIFAPDPSMRDWNYVTVVVVSRLVYRKGIDLLVAIIPQLCSAFASLRFLIGGDGPKRLELEELRERHQLHSRVQLLGSLQPDEVRPLLVKGDIFLNTSLTDSFCIAIIEAVSCGLLVVSTAVGGIPEVLPEQFIKLSSPNVLDLISAMSVAIKEVHRQRHMSIALESACQQSETTTTVQKNSCKSLTRPGPRCRFSISSNSKRLCSLVKATNADNEGDRDEYDSMCTGCDSLARHQWHMHEWVRHTYSWSKVAKYTERVYLEALGRPPPSLSERLSWYYKLGPFTGKLVVLCAFLHWLLLQFLIWFRPLTPANIVPSFPFSTDDCSDSE